MEKKDLISFVKNFCSSETISMQTVIQVIKELSPKEKELFVSLVNFKNGKDFMEKLKNGSI